MSDKKWIGDREAELAELKMWKDAVYSLTPGGSEFVDNPMYCAAYIRSKTDYPKIIIDLRTQLAERDRIIADCWKLANRWFGELSVAAAGDELAAILPKEK